jgi:hypothetical protein
MNTLVKSIRKHILIPDDTSTESGRTNAWNSHTNEAVFAPIRQVRFNAEVYC